MPTRLKMKAPMKVDRTFWEVESSTSSRAARGVAVLAAAEKAATMVPSENVATASMLEAMICRIVSTESAPKTLVMLVASNTGGTKAATSAVTIATSP